MPNNTLKLATWNDIARSMTKAQGLKVMRIELLDDSPMELTKNVKEFTDSMDTETIFNDLRWELKLAGVLK